MCSLRFLCVLLVFSGAALSDALLEKTDLFMACEGGYDLYRIPGILSTPSGNLIVTCEARMESPNTAAGDWTKMDVLMRRSEDGGVTWSPPVKLANPPADFPLNPMSTVRDWVKPGDITVHNAMGIADHVTQEVHFLYGVEYNRYFYVRSSDDGRTFEEPVDITATFEAFRPDYDWKIIAAGPGHGIQLRTGRLLAPIWMSTGTGSGAHRPSAVSVIYSDDHGKTWQRGALVAAHPDLVNPNETIALELADGRVMLNIRHETTLRNPRRRLRALSFSDNGIDGWSAPRFEEALPESICMASILRLSHPGKDEKSRILFANPHNPKTTERKNVALKLSYDEGETWPVMKVLEPGRSGYTDLATNGQGDIFCFYERGSFGKTHFTTAALCLARFNLEWLLDDES
jgi:sialidase-1